MRALLAPLPRGVWHRSAGVCVTGVDRGAQAVSQGRIGTGGSALSLATAPPIRAPSFPPMLRHRTVAPRGTGQPARQMGILRKIFKLTGGDDKDENTRQLKVRRVGGGGAACHKGSNPPPFLPPPSQICAALKPPLEPGHVYE